MDNSKTPKEECIAILNARIEDYRAMEKACSRLGINIDTQRIANIIGGLRKVISFIEINL